MLNEFWVSFHDTLKQKTTNPFLGMPIIVWLESIKAIYITSDRSNGKKYIGSSYRECSVWFRWSIYIASVVAGFILNLRFHVIYQIRPQSRQ